MNPSDLSTSYIYSLVLSNMNRHPYHIPNDNIVLKADVKYRGRSINKKDIPIDIYFLIGEDWKLYGSSVTTEYGSVYINISTDIIPSVNNCLAMGVMNIDGINYGSTIQRLNFITKLPEDFVDSMIVDAGHNDEAYLVNLDRSDYTIFDSQNRSTSYTIDGLGYRS